MANQEEVREELSLRFGLLGLLTYRDMTGYDLNKAFESSLQFMWNAKASQIYRELGKMEDEGLVTSHIEAQHKKFDRKVYSITSSGKRAFQEWLETFPNDLTFPVRDEFIVRVFFGQNLNAENLAFEIQRFKRQREEALQDLGRVSGTAKEAAEQDGLEESHFYWALTINKARKEIRAEIEWADETIKELKGRI